MRGGGGGSGLTLGLSVSATDSRLPVTHPVRVHDVPEGVAISPRYDLYRSKALITLILDLFVLFKGNLTFLVTRFFVFFLRHLLHLWRSSSVVFTGEGC